jgi:Family of unknown function (DUF5996)
MSDTQLVREASTSKSVDESPSGPAGTAGTTCRSRIELEGKRSPVHFSWRVFHLAVMRFSGRPAPVHPGGMPRSPDWVMVEAYDAEVSSCGHWPRGADGDVSYATPTPSRVASATSTRARTTATLASISPSSFPARRCGRDMTLGVSCGERTVSQQRTGRRQFERPTHNHGHW